MVDRLRALLDRSLDPSAARAILLLASAILLGVAALFVLAGGESHRPTLQEARPAAAFPSVPVAPVEEVNEAVEHHSPTRRQDPQDEEGSAAARRAARALRSHRALQHVPYRRGELAITLVGTRGVRAVLRVSALNLSSARRGWRAFLRRYHDRGEAYIARFVARGEGRRR
jgi:hypothetical protein